MAQENSHSTRPSVLLVERRRGMRIALLGDPRVQTIQFVHRGSIGAALRVPCKPQAAFVDLRCAESAGRAIAQLAVHFSKVPIVGVGDREYKSVVTAINTGASGYIFFDEIALRLAPAVECALGGGMPFSDGALRIVVARARRDRAGVGSATTSPHFAEARLTRAQTIVLTKLYRGLSYEQIALELRISINTVRTHVREIYERLGARTKIEAIRAGIRLAFIDR